ncbi:extracellular solute-binding protein [Paenibacillus sp. 1P07SE]|uniref:extracellular solute-binding protein n=1 Tax=Paenibacillus sp. 1P07SE TaxID=3132209 RepID=UPI0039A74230
MIKRKVISWAAAALLTSILAGCGTGMGAEGETVTVYTSRHYAADQALYAAFTEQTGIRVTEVKGTPQELMERLRHEGESTGGDLFVTVDVAAMAQAKRDGILQRVQSAAIEEQVPARWRDADGQWVGLAARARVIVYDRERVDRDRLRTYRDLADEQWRGRVVMRSSANQYNLSLMASMIGQEGEDAAREWAEGIASNLAGAPAGGDREQALLLADGVGDVSLMNTYYIGQMLASEHREQRIAASRLGIVFPDAASGGTHVNLSGIGLLKHAPNPSGATRLIEFMTSQEGQSMLSALSYEYPVHPLADMPTVLREWGELQPQALDYDLLGELQVEAAALVEGTGWD